MRHPATLSSHPLVNAMQVWRESGAGQSLSTQILQVHLQGLRREEGSRTSPRWRPCFQHRLQGVLAVCCSMVQHLL